MKYIITIGLSLMMAVSVFGQKDAYKVNINLEGETLYNLGHTKDIRVESKEKNGNFKVETDYKITLAAIKGKMVSFNVDLAQFDLKELNDKGEELASFSSSELAKDKFPLDKKSYLFVQYDLETKSIVAEKGSKDSFMSLSSLVSEDFRTLFKQNISRRNVEELISIMLMYNEETILLTKKDEYKLEKEEIGSQVVSGSVTTEVKSEDNNMISLFGERLLETSERDMTRNMAISNESNLNYSSAISKKRGIVYDYQLNGVIVVSESNLGNPKENSTRTETISERFKVK